MKISNYEQQEQLRGLKERLAEYLERRGIDTRKPFRCLNPEHKEQPLTPEHTRHTPSMSYDAVHNRVKCFSCNASYDVIDLIALERGINPKDGAAAFRAAREYFGLDKPTGGAMGASVTPSKPKPEPKPETDYSAFFLQAQASISDTDYLQKRGISKETAARFGLGYVKGFQAAGASSPWPGALIIPLSKSSYEARNTNTSAEGTNRYRKKGAARLFNSGALQTAQKPIFIVEGVIDCLSVLEGGGEAVGLGSAANYTLLLAELEKRKPIQPIILALDSDKAGTDATAKLETELKRMNISFYRHSWTVHDANDELQADRDKFIERLREAEEQPTAEQAAARAAYLQPSAASHLQGFVDGIADSVNTEYIPTGFPQLDKILDGGLFEGLYVMGAISSLGKTSLVLQIADKIAERGHDVLYFSLEMSRSELMAKSISRLTLLETQGGDIRNAKTARGITTGSLYDFYSETEKNIIASAIASYESYAERIFIHEGIGDIGAAQIRHEIDKHFSFTGNKPVVFIDYLQILAPYEIKATDKQNTDKAVLELKRMSRDYKIPVIAISSFNRENYSSGVSMEAFK